MRNQEELQRLLRPLVTPVSDVKALLPGAAVGVVEGQEVVNIQQLMEQQTNRKQSLIFTLIILLMTPASQTLEWTSGSEVSSVWILNIYQ